MKARGDEMQHCSENDPYVSLLSQINGLINPVIPAVTRRTLESDTVLFTFRFIYFSLALVHTGTNNPKPRAEN